MKLKITKDEVVIIEDTILHDGEYKANICEFEFDEIYNDLICKAVFKLGYDKPYKMDITDNKCDIPSEVVKIGELEIGVYGYELDDGNLVLRYSPSPVKFNVTSGSYIEDSENSSTPTPSEIEQLESQLNSKQDKLISGNNIKTINDESLLGEGNIEIKGSDIDAYTKDETDVLLNEKADIEDVQEVAGQVFTKAEQSDLEALSSQVQTNTTNISNKADKSQIDTLEQEIVGKADTSDIPTKTSDLNNDSGFITGYTETDPTVPSHVKGITTSDISNWNNKSEFSGSYNDLTNKPTIPAEVTESTVSGWGFTKNTGTYSKPANGIPKTDLASDVQTSLGKADTALQSYTEQYTGTITGITMNGSSKGTSGVVDLGTVITAHQDISGKENSSNKVTSISASSTDTQYPSAKAVWTLFNSITDGDGVSY